MRQNPWHFLALLALTKFKVHDFESRTIWIKDFRQVVIRIPSCINGQVLRLQPQHCWARVRAQLNHIER
jgi:hypothetical protein